jgi:hypothetical protein
MTTIGLEKDTSTRPRRYTSSHRRHAAQSAMGTGRTEHQHYPVCWPQRMLGRHSGCLWRPPSICRARRKGQRPQTDFRNSQQVSLLSFDRTVRGSLDAQASDYGQFDGHRYGVLLWHLLLFFVDGQARYESVGSNWGYQLDPGLVVDDFVKSGWEEACRPVVGREAFGNLNVLPFNVSM